MAKKKRTVTVTAYTPLGTFVTIPSDVDGDYDLSVSAQDIARQVDREDNFYLDTAAGKLVMPSEVVKNSVFLLHLDSTKPGTLPES